MASRRYLIVNADDFGQSPGVNQGVIEACERGILTSASLMVRWPAAAEAAAYSRAHAELSVGLHLDLGEWAYRGDAWVCLYEVAPLEPAAVRQELTRQLTAFHRLMGRGPSHIDSHQHVHGKEPVRTAAVEAAQALGVPLRHFSPGIFFCGSFYGQGPRGWCCPEAISVAGLIETLTTLPPGVTELACHPGRGDIDSMYVRERAVEVATLCDPRVRTALAAGAIELCSFHGYRGVTP